MQKGVTTALVNTALVMPARVHPRTRSRVPARIDGAGDQGRRGAGRRRVPRRHQARHRPDGRFDRHQPVHGRLRVPARPDSAVGDGDPEGHRVERHGDRVEHPQLPVGPARRRRSGQGGRRRRPVREGGLAAPVRIAGRGDHASRRIPDRLPGRRLRQTLFGPRRDGAGGRKQGDARHHRARRSRRALLLQAARDQGRIRSRAAVRRIRLHAARGRAVRGRLQAHASTWRRQCSTSRIR